MLAIRKKHQEAGACDSVRNSETPPQENGEQPQVSVKPEVEHAKTNPPPEVEESKGTDDIAQENNLKLGKKHSVQKDILERERENYYSRLAENEIEQEQRDQK